MLNIKLMSLPWPTHRRNFSLVTCYWLKFTRCLLLVVKSLVTRCKTRLLLVAEVPRCKQSLVTRCRIDSLLVAEVAHYKNSLLTCCKIYSLLVAEVARYKHSLVTEVSRCKKYLLFVENFDRYLLHKVTPHKHLSSSQASTNDSLLIVLAMVKKVCEI